MSVATTVTRACEGAGIKFDVQHHAHTAYSQATAHEAHVPGDRVAKAVLLQDENGPVMAVLPATHRLDMDLVSELLGRQLELMKEQRLSRVFDDCEPGAVPATGPAYDVATVVSDVLADEAEVWFEGGDHENLVHVLGADFRHLMKDAKLGRISHHI